MIYIREGGSKAFILFVNPFKTKDLLFNGLLKILNLDFLDFYSYKSRQLFINAYYNI